MESWRDRGYRPVEARASLSPFEIPSRCRQRCGATFILVTKAELSTDGKNWHVRINSHCQDQIATLLALPIGRYGR